MSKMDVVEKALDRMDLRFRYCGETLRTSVYHGWHVMTVDCRDDRLFFKVILDYVVPPEKVDEARKQIDAFNGLTGPGQFAFDEARSCVYVGFDMGGDVTVDGIVETVERLVVNANEFGPKICKKIHG